MRRIDNLTGVRAFAASWVVLYHLQTQSVRAAPLGSLILSGALGVDIFFVLSGFVLALVYDPRLEPFSWPWYRKFLRRRLAKVYPMHLITLMMMLALALAGRYVHYQFHHSPENTPWTFFSNVLMMHALGTTQTPSWNIFSWSVSAEWFAYSVLFAPILLGLRRWSAWAILGLAAVAWTAFLLFCHFGLHADPVTVTTLGALRIAPEFLCGYALYRILPRVALKGDLLTALGTTLIVLVAMFPATAFWLLMPGVMLLLAGAHRQGPWTNRMFGNRLSVLIGEASYSIYLFQMFPLLARNVLLRKIHLPFFGSTLLTEACSFILTICCGLGCFLWIEEPLRQWLLRPARAGERPQTSIRTDTRISSTIG